MLSSSRFVCAYRLTRSTLLAALTLVSALALVLATTQMARAQTLTALHSFDSTDGSEPIAGLIQGTDGNFYGTASEGGANSAGTVFQITPGGNLTTLYSFCALADCTDGSEPSAALVQGTDGNFYGTTLEGGAHNDGTIFELTPGGTLTTLYSFCSQSGCTDGSYPDAALIQGTDGNFYGTTIERGTLGYGTVFKLIPNGALSTLSTLHSFGLTDGDYAGAPLIQATDGNFYGTTQAGGAGTVKKPEGHGTIFEITSEGIFTNLYTFCPGKGRCMDGAQPIAGLVQGTDGNFYGTTSTGGAYANCASGCGTVFKLVPNGALSTLTTLVKFNFDDGYYPVGGVIQAADGNFYGTTSEGGANGDCAYGCGTVFEVTSKPKLTTLATFDITDGDFPCSTLLLATNGNLYGTTQAGGVNEGLPGTVFEVAPTPSSTALISSLNPSLFGESFTFTATVSSSSGTPKGAVTFKSGNKKLGSAMLTDGVATFTTTATTFPDAGTKSITAEYLGGDWIAGSTSSALSQTVDKASSTVLLSSSLNPSSVGQPVTFTATVQPQFTGTVPKGMIMFKNGHAKLGSVMLTDGTAALTTTTLSEGTDSITAVYNGSASFSGSTSPVLSEVVN
jgi:uncharacterized repeat protein (TIGR03803 family)